MKMYSLPLNDILCTHQCSQDVCEPNFGVVGENYNNSRLMFILHHSDYRATNGHSQYQLKFENVKNIDVSYVKALQDSDTGRVLNWLFKACRDLRKETPFPHDLTWENIYITNFFKCLLDGEKNIEKTPRKAIYSACGEVLHRQILIAKPRKIVAFGGKVVSGMFPDVQQQSLESLTFIEKQYEGIPVLLSPHPGHIHRKKSDVCRSYLRTIRTFMVT